MSRRGIRAHENHGLSPEPQRASDPRVRIIQPSGPDCKANPVRACMKLGSQREHAITAVLGSCYARSQVCKQAWHARTCTCACVLEFAFRLVGAFWQHVRRSQLARYSDEYFRLSPQFSYSHAHPGRFSILRYLGIHAVCHPQRFLLPVVVYNDAQPQLPLRRDETGICLS